MRAWPVVVLFVAPLLAGCPVTSAGSEPPDPDVLLVFHNNSGPMCLAALAWLADIGDAHPTLVIEEHLTYESGEAARLAQYEALHSTSQGVSASFAYLPIIFYQGQAFSGFDDETAQALEALLAAAESGS
ncbi:MAG TPA: hypothetical protein PLQ87_06100 [Phycisphaerae bacterium]|jgi:hypothetical protein|nr:hypothetical protein [Phycisphaerae bacterium]